MLGHSSPTFLTSLWFLFNEKKESQQNKMPPLNHFATFCVKTVMGNAHIQRKVTALPEHLTQFMLILLHNCAGTDGSLSQFNVAFEGLWHFQDTTEQ